MQIVIQKKKFLNSLLQNQIIYTMCHLNLFRKNRFLKMCSSCITCSDRLQILNRNFNGGLLKCKNK